MYPARFAPIGTTYRRVLSIMRPDRLIVQAVPHVASTARPGRNDPHDVVFFRRHTDDDPSQSVPAREFLMACPTTVRARFAAVLVAVASAPPHRFAGGGYWESMHGEMVGWFEVRVDGPKPGGGKGRHHYRLFCLLD